MASRPVHTDTRIINPMFPLPEGLTGFEYGVQNVRFRTADADTPDSEVNDEAADQYYLDTETTENDYSGAPDIPEILGVISQTVHTAATGQQVVDLLLEVEDISGVEYEFQVARV